MVAMEIEVESSKSGKKFRFCWFHDLLLWSKSAVDFCNVFTVAIFSIIEQKIFLIS